MSMVGKRLFLVLAAGALVLLQFTDCMAALAPDQQSMKCCGSMQCTRTNQSHDCCKKMVSEQSPNMLPTGHVSLSPPAAVLVELLISPATVRIGSLQPGAVEAPQHSPPKLYTLHACFLI